MRFALALLVAVLALVLPAGAQALPGDPPIVPLAPGEGPPTPPTPPASR